MQNTVTRILIWVGFIAFLSASIPHVAWVFYAFEGGDNSTFGLTMFGWNVFTVDKWWFLSYLEAISIDVLIAWLSHILTSGKVNTDRGIGYTFIVILVAISWYFNWIYAKEHAPVDVGIWTHTLMWGWLPIGKVTPIITSALPVFAIGYAIMLSRLTEAPPDVSEIEARLKARKDIADLRKQYASDEGRVVSFLKKGIKDAADISTAAKDALSQVRQGQVTPVQSPTIGQSASDPILAVTPVLSAASTGSTTVVTPLQSDGIDQGINGSIAVQTESNEAGIEQSEMSPIEQSKVSQNGSTSRVYVPIEEAVELLQYDLSYVKSLRTKGTLRTSGKNQDLITMASINAVLSKKPKPTTKHPKVTSIIQDRDTGEMEIQTGILQSNSADTSDETPEYELDLVASHS